MSRCKLDRSAVEDIRLRLAAGETRADLSKEYGLARGSIGPIARFETWPDVPGPPVESAMAAAAPIPKELELEPGWWLKITGEEAIRVAVSAMCHAYADVEAASARVAHLERRDLDRLRTSELVVLYAVIRGLSADVQCFEGPRLDLLMASFSEAAIRVQVVRDAYLPRARRVLGRLAQIAVAIEGRKSRASRATVRRRQLDLELALELAG